MHVCSVHFETSPTTLSFVGALNKFPTTILAAFFFGSQTTFFGWIFIFLNVAATFVYVMAKAHKLGNFMSKDFLPNRKMKLKSKNQSELSDSDKLLELGEYGSDIKEDKHGK